jgi:hypothetical protein
MQYDFLKKKQFSKKWRHGTDYVDNIGERVGQTDSIVILIVGPDISMCLRPFVE